MLSNLKNGSVVGLLHGHAVSSETNDSVHRLKRALMTENESDDNSQIKKVPFSPQNCLGITSPNRSDHALMWCTYGSLTAPRGVKMRRRLGHLPRHQSLAVI